ncbi:MAG TPA: LuxR C-terminal-related transcriptional regulator [Nitrospiraceae bacterium]|nr:LuxR C-terminal-related transcriptional regulator [Nitrospiraceae bacterium]
MLKESRAIETGTTAELDPPSHAGHELATSSGTRRARRPEDLTPREREILQLVWDGYTSRLIAERLGISIKTAEAHRANMMKKLRASNTAQLVKAAFEAGLLKASFTDTDEESVVLESIEQETA